MWSYLVIFVIIIVAVGLLSQADNRPMSISGGVLLAIGLLALFTKAMRSM